jgi:hypothetical protein
MRIWSFTTTKFFRFLQKKQCPEKGTHSMKKILYFSLLLLFSIACESDLNSINASFIDNKNFESKELISEVSFSSDSISSVNSSTLGQYLLGVYNNPNFGTLKASFVSQLSLPTSLEYTSESYGADTLVVPSLDGVVLYIPYQATLDVGEDQKPRYSLDSIFGTYDSIAESYGSFDFEVHELETFLNPLSPSDPSRPNRFDTDRTYETRGVLATVSNFSPSAKDTVTYVKRSIDGTVYDTDTIQLTNAAPRIAIPLDTDFFQTKILDKLPAKGAVAPEVMSSQQDFIRYFRGLYLKTVSGTHASIASLLLSNAFVEMYYTNVVRKVSTGAILDTIKRAKTFSFGGVRASKYEHDHTGASDTGKIYVQGASGFQANIKLFGYDSDQPNIVSLELQSLLEDANDDEGNPKWLINEASLTFYVDKSNWLSATDKVFKLFLYKKTPNYNSQILDYITAASFSTEEGVLQKDENDAYYYQFRVTDYITKLLNGTQSKNVDNLGLKVFANGDLPISTSDTLVTSNNWNPRGVVLDGSLTKLKINYSVQND